MRTDPRIDAYIEKAAPFAQPILRHLRARVHAACPEADEAIKWGMPSFTLNGKLLCGMAAFKAHATFGFHGQRDVVGDAAREGAMGAFGRLTTIDDLPGDDALGAMIAEAARRVAAGEKPARPAPPAKPAPEAPTDLIEAFAGAHGARTFFDALAPGQQRDYVDWITEAKRPETRAKRVAQSVEWLGEGKRRNWKYENC